MDISPVLPTILLEMAKIRIPTPSDKVFKDECLYSFDTPFSDEGLYVNLSTFHGVGTAFVIFDSKKQNSKLYLHEKWQEGKMHFVNNNFAHFIDRYNKRIRNFYDYIYDPKNNINFIIQFAYDTNPNDDCAELREALSKKFPHLKYSIIVI